MTPTDLRTAREALGMSQAEFAEALGYSGPHTRAKVSAWEGGRIPIPARVLVALPMLVKLAEKE